MPEPEGGRQFGPYRLFSQIATGGMAEIHLASAKGLQGFEKVVALKMIHPNFSSDDHFVEMLVDEAKISVQLQHVNIAHVFDLGKVGDTYYIAMEYVDGCDLFKVLRKASELERIMAIETAAYIGKEVCAGLDYAHRKRDASGRSMGIVHRDVSPQNVLLSHAGEVKIVDFGIAKATMRGKQTAVGVIKGKYYYMSPEQAWGDPVDVRTDIFSAGILVYEMLTGQMLYLEEDMNRLLGKVRKADIPPPSTKRPDVPRDLDQIVMRALSKKPDLRWQSAHDFGAALEEFLHGYAPDYSAGRLAAYVNQIVPPAPPPVSPSAPVAVPAKNANETARVTRGVEPSIMRSRSEFTDENSVIYRLGQSRETPEMAPELPPEPASPAPAPRVSPNRVTRPSPPVRAADEIQTVRPVRPVKRPSVAPDRVTTPHAVPPATMTVDETHAAATLVSQPSYATQAATLPSGTIELEPDMLEPVDGTIELSAADLTAEAPGTSDVTVTAPRPSPPAAAAAAAHTPTRRSRRTPGAGVPSAVSARVSAALPLSAPTEDSTPARSVAVWPPQGRDNDDSDDNDNNDNNDDGFGVRIGHFNLKKLLVFALVIAAMVGIGAFAVAAFSGAPLGRATADDAAVMVISVPQGARVLVDGNAVGTTPHKLDHLAVGKPVHLRLELERYQPWQEVEEVGRAGSVDVVASLKPIRGTLTVLSTPPGAEVLFGSRSLGTTPLVIRDMDPFVDGTIEVRKEGHRPSRQALTWGKALEATLKFELVSSANSN